MKFHLTKAFFVPAAAIVFFLSLSSCGKDYDLVSDYVVRENVETNILEDNMNSQNSSVTSIDAQNNKGK
ncbi:hypothetical protein SAMN05192540_1962 [Maribacter dokdonensis]|uniref:Uncharacterized protein n=1 Tax=Maribacter dokdonensis TaxID=320912 RepID=A0A1H4NHM1_9FLAO|nr:hypothetical protein [Maribacter dokdonensis]SEB94800.1 hypothetical protein SAMN05192540_1962 [Maribacter dokdonensis]